MPTKPKRKATVKGLVPEGKKAHDLGIKHAKEKRPMRSPYDDTELDTIYVSAYRNMQNGQIPL